MNVSSASEGSLNEVCINEESFNEYIINKEFNR